MSEVLAAERPEGSSHPVSRRTLWLVRVGLAAACFLIFAAAPAQPFGSDSYLVLPTAYSMAHQGNLKLDEFTNPGIKHHYANVEVNGSHYNYFPWAVSIFAVPTVVAFDAAHALGIGAGSFATINGGSFAKLERVAAASVAALAMFFLSVLVWDRLDMAGGRRRLWASVIVIVAVAFGTSVFSEVSRGMWQHGPSILMIVIALLCASKVAGAEERAWAWAAVAGAASAGAYMVRPTNAVFVLTITVWMLVRYRRTVIAFLTGCAVPMALWFLVNRLSFASWQPPYNSASRVSLHHAYFEAFAANVVSPARGLFIFSPILLLAVPGLVLAIRRHGPESDILEGACAAAAALYLAAVSGFGENWWAGASFGPRFMSDTIPMLTVTALPAVTWLALRGWSSTGARVVSVVTGAALIWSLVVNGQGAVLRSSGCWNVGPPSVDEDPSRIWNLGNPQVISGLRIALEDGPRNAIDGVCSAGT